MSTVKNKGAATMKKTEQKIRVNTITTMAKTPSRIESWRFSKVCKSLDL
jgi:hypothetical protein